MTRTPDLQHVSYAVRDALAFAEALRANDGAIPVAGETLDEFRYVLLHLGGATGGYLELMEPTNQGFLSRFLDKHGEGPHHLTWMVPDLKGCVAAARALGFTIVGEDYSTASWQEAFFAPHPATGCVIQLACSDRDYPTGEDLASVEARARFFARGQLPASPGAINDDWWVSIAKVSAGPAVAWGGVRLRSTDPQLLHSLFVSVLGGRAEVGSTGTTYRWPGGCVDVEEGTLSSIQGVVIDGQDLGRDLLVSGEPRGIARESPSP